MRRFTILSIVLLTLACAGKEPLKVYPELGLTCPCEVRRWEGYSDGGSRGGVIHDFYGRVLKIAWDGRMRIVGRDDLLRPRLAYIRAEHPSRDGAVPLPLGSAAESELITLFDEWVSTQIPPDSLDKWSGFYFDFSIPREERMSKLPELTEEQKRALSVAATSRYLRRQRELGYAPGHEDR
jgi:hypothetical protein